MKITIQILVAAILAVPMSAFAGVSRDANGWTQITASADSRVVYVSSSTGNDSNDGLSATTPKATITAGDSLIRDGYPDHLLLKRGDTFTLASGGLGSWKSGRSATEPLVFSYYGTSGARPVVKIVDTFINHNGHVRNYEAFIGVEIYKSNSDPSSPDYTGVPGTEGLRFVGGGANLRIEDCRIRFMQITIENYDVGIYTDVEFRRNIVLDAWMQNSFTTGAEIQGLYVSGTNGYLIEENFFDHNGWSEVVANAGANEFNHNIYVQYDNQAGGIMRGNILAEGAAHGLQARSGGQVDRNLFVLNAVGLNVGGVDNPTDPNVLTYPNFAHNNVVLNGRLMSTINSDYPRTAAVWGIEENEFVPGASIDGNIVANRIDNGSNSAYDGKEYMNFGSNISYKWDSTQDTTNPAWPHPDDDLGDYNASIGGTNSTAAYLTTQRNRALGNLPWTLTAYAAINYIRAGFLQPPITGVYSYPGDGGGTGGGGNLLSFGDFEPNQATVLQDMPTTYTLGSGSTNIWFARVGTVGGQTTAYQTSGSDHYVTVGSSGNTNGCMQVITWPGAGNHQVQFSYRGTGSYVKIYGGNAGNTIDEYDGVNTLTLLATITNPTSSSWQTNTQTVNLTGSYTYLVIQLRAGDFNNVSFAGTTAATPLSFGDFEPDQATVLQDMPTVYTVGSGVTHIWFGRVGTVGGQTTTYQTSGSNHYVTVGGSANTNGCMQVIPWPGAGSHQVQFQYRGTGSYVKIYGANAGNTIDEYDGANTLTLLATINNPTNASWTQNTQTVNLAGSYSYLVVQLRGGDFDNVTLSP
ncbi:MAG TPA: hypothetical protein VIM69_09965 [Opitutaceae bacterium]